jgi:hypothetical protein
MLAGARRALVRSIMQGYTSRGRKLKRDRKLKSDRSAQPLLRRRCLTGLYVGTALDSTKHGRNVLFECDEMLPTEENCRPAALSRLDHQDLVEVY